MHRRDSSSYFAEKMKLNFGRAAPVIVQHEQRPIYPLGFAEVFLVEIKFADAGVGAPRARVEIENAAAAAMRDFGLAPKKKRPQLNRCAYIRRHRFNVAARAAN